MSDQFKCEFAKLRKAEMLAQGAFETEDFGFAGVVLQDIARIEP